ncbi:Serine/threonine/tyrosine-protein kinase HT1-like protein [Cladobotryum mycophilum]|uniref:EKC/KEOPS complex subunit BUD32 n=1 Tax=Cladobotryum mycophilum TaxID=491253 RepID=A0ABR0SVE0_9HYPO
MENDFCSSIISSGASAYISSTDKKTALKSYQVWEDGELRAYFGEDCENELAREAFIYKMLDEHPNILACHGLEEIHHNVNALRMEYAPLGDVRKYIRQHKETPLSIQIRLRMALDTAAGLSHMHSKNIQYCDMSCRNLLLFPGYRVKLADFGGSCVEGHELYGKPGIYEEMPYELPLRGRKELGDRPARKRELFALGSAIYEMMAWVKPCEGMTEDEIEARYAAEEFPDVDEIIARDIIQGCWDERYESADEVAQLLERLIASRSKSDGEVEGDQDVNGNETH